MPKAPKTQSSPRATGTQRPFKCNCCDQRFERKAELTRHEVLHSENVNDHKLECTYTGCGYRTLQKSNLKTHINAVHLKLKKHKCRSEGCQSAFGDPASRVRHEKSQHGIGRTDQSKRTREATVEYTVETPSVPVIALPALYTFSDSESSTGGSSQSEGSSTRGSSPGSSLSPITPTYPLLSLPSAAGPSCPTDADYTDAELTLNYGDPNLYPPFDPSLCQFGAQTTVNQQAWFPATGFSIPTIPPSCFSLDYSSSYSGYISSEVTQEFTVPELPPAGFSFSFPPPTSEYVLPAAPLGNHTNFAPGFVRNQTVASNFPNHFLFDESTFPLHSASFTTPTTIFMQEKPETAASSSPDLYTQWLASLSDDDLAVQVETVFQRVLSGNA